MISDAVMYWLCDIVLYVCENKVQWMIKYNIFVFDKSIKY